MGSETSRIVTLLSAGAIAIAGALPLTAEVHPRTPANAPGAQPAPAGLAAEEKLPELHIEEPIFDWGSAFRGERIEHSFKIKNRGEGTLVIQEVKPQCGCTLATDHPKELAPGESMELTLTLESGAMDRGSKEKYTEIISNALTEDNKLWMRGEVEDLFFLDPKMPKVESVIAVTAKPKPTVIELVPNLDRPYKITSAAARKKLLAVELKPTDVARKYTVGVTPQIPPESREAFQEDMIDLQVNVDGKSVTLSFPVTITLLERITVDPSKSVYFPRKQTSSLPAEGPVPAADKLPKKVLDVRSIGGPGHHFRITHLEIERVKDNVFDAKYETIEEGKHYRITVTVTKRSTRRSSRGKIILKTDDPEVPVIAIPLAARF